MMGLEMRGHPFNQMEVPVDNVALGVAGARP
jgi:hypothetical protein